LNSCNDRVKSRPLYSSRVQPVLSIGPHFTHT